MLTRKKVSKRKILHTLSDTDFRMRFFEDLASTAMIALSKVAPEHQIFKGAAAIAVLREQHKKQREDRLTMEWCLMALIIGFGLGATAMLIVLSVK